MTTPLLQALAVGHIYGQKEMQVTALQNINLSIQAGEVTLLMGPSGSGKTTLVQILGALLRPTSGQVFFKGKPFSHLSEEKRCVLRRHHLGFIFQSSNLFPMLTASENVQITLDLLGITGAEAVQRADALLTRVGLKDRRHHYPTQLSGGQRQRVGIARALAGNPSILLADEPTASLDAESGHTVMTMLHDLAHQQGKAVVIVTHDHRLIPMSDRTIHIADGKLTD